MELIFLGTGTSTGVPQLRCGCKVCRSDDPADHRLRTSALLLIGQRRILIDCGPDFRQQMLRHGRRAADDRLDALLVTHQHYDHVGGLDDLRPYCYRDGEPYNFPVYCQADVIRDLRTRMPYSFAKHLYPGVPRYDLHEIKAFQSFDVDGVDVLPLHVNHYKLEILGFRIGNLAYITDAKVVPDETIERIKRIDTLVLNALRPKPHLSHLSLSEALEIVDRINPRVAYLTHFSHELGLASEVAPTLPERVRLAADDLEISIPD